MRGRQQNKPAKTHTHRSQNNGTAGIFWTRRAKKQNLRRGCHGNTELLIQCTWAPTTIEQQQPRTQWRSVARGKFHASPNTCAWPNTSAEFRALNFVIDKRRQKNTQQKMASCYSRKLHVPKVAVNCGRIPHLQRLEEDRRAECLRAQKRGADRACTHPERPHRGMLPTNLDGNHRCRQTKLDGDRGSPACARVLRPPAWCCHDVESTPPTRIRSSGAG